MRIEQARPVRCNGKASALSVCAALLLIALAHPADAAPRRAAGEIGGRHSQSQRLTSKQRSTAIDQIISIITESYVFAELRAPIAARLRQGLAEHRYDDPDPERFAARITDDLREIAHDGHLFLSSDPAKYAAASAPEESVAGLAAYRRDRAIREHHGIAELALLPGNIRYLKITGFEWLDDGSTARAYEDAAAFLRDGDAVIVDLRGNGGGESDAADYFLRAILGPDGTPRGGDAPPARPAYLLIDGFTGSAAEGVSYAAKLEHRAVIVGATSYGAANNSRQFPIAPQFLLSISYHRPINPISGTNWEGVGVAPDIAVDPLLASQAAQRDAIEQLAARPGTTPERLAEYRWREAGLSADLEPANVDAPVLRALAGIYGPIALRFERGSLRLYRPDRPHWPQGMALRPMSGDGLFALVGTDDIRLRLTRDRLDLLRPGSAAPESFARAGP